jgi:hypothetical protein
MYEQELFQLFSQASHFSRSVLTSQSQQYGFALSTIISHILEHFQSLPF